MLTALRCRAGDRPIPGAVESVPYSRLLHSDGSFGFIQPDDGGTEVYFHATEIAVQNYGSPDDNQPADYKLTQGPQRPPGSERHSPVVGTARWLDPAVIQGQAAEWNSPTASETVRGSAVCQVRSGGRPRPSLRRGTRRPRSGGWCGTSAPPGTNTPRW
ncbi:cold-shock protein [Streptomyces sp. NPDC048595]|uniref:cold-shock protein n=1 Tax=Streptomyces sp. NPDC048595 TaxID=3365576 RepID=UPI00371D09E8